MSDISAAIPEFTRQQSHIIAHFRECCLRSTLEIQTNYVAVRICIGTCNVKRIHKAIRTTVEYKCSLLVNRLVIGTFAQANRHHAHVIRKRFDNSARYNGSYLVLD